MTHRRISLAHKDADSYVIPFGPFNLVLVATGTGMVGCGMVDVAALDWFDYPAARVRSSTGGAIATVDDLLEGIVKDVNKAAQRHGIEIGMTGRQALDLL